MGKHLEKDIPSKWSLGGLYGLTQGDILKFHPFAFKLMMSLLIFPKRPSQNTANRRIPSLNQ